MSKNTQLGNLVNGIYVDASGNVGIGTSAPSSKLHLVGTLRINNPSVSGQYMELYTSSGISYYNSQNNSAFYTAFQHIFNTDGASPAERMRITSAGNVGIGTSSPSTLLHISKSTSGEVLRIESTATNSGSVSPYLQFISANQVGGTGFAAGYIGSIWTAEGNGFSMAFATKAVDGGQVERMRILHNGNIGIGGASSEGAATDDRVLTIHNSNSTGSMRSMIRFTNYNSGTAWGNGAFLTTDSSNNFYVSNLEANDIIFQTNGTARLYLTGDGKMSIPYTTLAYTGNMTMYWNNSTGVVGVLTSSRRFKKDIVSLTSEQAKMALSLNPVEYTRLETNEREYGFIAEEVKEAGLGLLVPEMDGSPITVDYARISVIAIAMIKEQQKAIQELKTEIEILKQK